MNEFNFLTEQQIQSNYERFRSLITENFPTRKDQLNQMYDVVAEELMFAPASSQAHFHNAFPGGYVDHVLRVYDFASIQLKLWDKCGMSISFTTEELIFVALHHDLGKLGQPESPMYLVNNEKWAVDKGTFYKFNLENQWLTITERSLWLLNHFNVPFSINEMLGIKLADGLYDESNKQYLVTYDINKKLKNNLPYIIHNADQMAARFEFERWAKFTGKAAV